MKLRRITAALLLAGTCACTSRELGPTQVVVRITADVALRERLDALRVRTSSNDGTSWAVRDTRDFTADQLSWPVDVIVVPGPGTARPDHVFEVVAAALDGRGERLVEARAISQFATHQQLVLPLALTLCGRPLYDVCEDDPACLGATCKTCTDGSCGDTPFIPADQLTPFDGDAGAPPDPRDDGGDAGGSSDPSDATPADADGTDAGAGRDAGCSAGVGADGGCVDIDECATDNVCSDDYACRNRPGDYYCRGLFPETPLGGGPRFVDEGDPGVVRDAVTGLWWQVALPYDSPGAPATYEGCSAPPGLLVPSPLGARCSHTEAVAYCTRAASTWAGDGWRLPTASELLSIVDDSRSGPAFDVSVFPDTPSDFFWTSSPAADGSGYWAVDALDGSSSNTIPSVPMAVRCVRGGDP